jgi:thiamine kinase-like enzyme
MSPAATRARSATDAILLDRAFASLPMLGSIAHWQVTALAGGSMNRSWLLATTDCKLVLRVPVGDTRELGVDRRGERVAIECAAQAGLAPQLVYFDDASGLMLSRFVEGRPWERGDAHIAQCVARLAARLRRLHELEPPKGARRLEYSTLIADYRRSLAARPEPRTRSSSALDGEADRRLLSAGATARVQALCHNDVHHRNVIEGESLWLIDWEYAAVGDPLYDLASFACYHDLDAIERIGLLEAYAPGAAPALTSSFDEHCWLFDYLHLLWLELTAADAADRQRLMQRLTKKRGQIYFHGG